MKRDKYYLKHSMEYYARCIRDVYPNVGCISIKVHGEASSFEHSIMDNEYKYAPSDKNLFLIPCPNRECNGIGFNLTSEVWNVIRNGVERGSGEMMCKEAESDKLGACACLSEIKYVISVEYL